MYGDLGYMGMSFQSSFGTANVSSMDYMPIVSESLTHEIEQIVTQTLQARFEEGPSYAGQENFKGDVVMEVHPIHVVKLLKAWSGQSSPTLVGSVYTHRVIPVQTAWDNFAALPPVTVEIYRDAGNSSYLFYDMCVDALTFEIANGALWRTTVGFVGGKFQKNAKAAPTYIPGSAYPFDVTSLQLGGAANVDHSKVTIKMNNKLKPMFFLNGLRTPGRILRGDKRTIDISGTTVYMNDTQADIFRAQTAQALVINARGQSLTTSQWADFFIRIPQMRYTTYPANIAGPGLIEVGYSGVAKYDESSATMIEFTMQNTRSGY